MNNLPKPSRITVTTDDLKLIKDMQRGYDSRELIDMYGVKFMATALSVSALFPASATMRAEEVRIVKPLPWNGEGWPPINTMCEMTHEHWGNRGWEVVIIKYFSDEYAITKDGSGEQHWHRRNVQFRPIRTEAQVAADRRLQAIEAAIKATLKDGKEIHLPTIGALYDAGLLKGEDQ